MKAVRHQAQSSRQRGVYAIEFAFVFLIFFTVLYSIICYGVLFTLRTAMQNAAEDGARAALRYQLNIPGRENAARTVAEAQSKGLFPANPVAAAKVCRLEGGDNCNLSALECGAAWNRRCQITVTVTATGIRQMLPPMPNFAVPNTLVVKASMLLDGKAL